MVKEVPDGDGNRSGKLNGSPGRNHHVKRATSEADAGVNAADNQSNIEQGNDESDSDPEVDAFTAGLQFLDDVLEILGDEPQDREAPREDDDGPGEISDEKS